MWTAKSFRRQAASCANLALQAHDEESRQRYMRLKQTFLDLAERDEDLTGQMSVFAGPSETKPADHF
jgi:hypothetical protein